MSSAQSKQIVFESRKFSDTVNAPYCGCVRAPHIPNNNPVNPSHRPGWVYLFELLDVAAPAGKKAYKVGKYEAVNLDEKGFLKKLRRRNTPYYRETYGCRFRIIHLIGVACAEGGEKQATRTWKPQRNGKGNSCEKYFLTSADVEAFKRATGTVLNQPVEHRSVTMLSPVLQGVLDITCLPSILD